MVGAERISKDSDKLLTALAIGNFDYLAQVRRTDSWDGCPCASNGTQVPRFAGLQSMATEVRIAIRPFKMKIA